MFRNRKDAGNELAAKLLTKDITNGLIMAIPRGGVVLAAVISQRLKLPVDVIIPKKIGAPFNPEMAVGAVTQDGTIIYDNHLLGLLGLEKEKLQPKVQEQIKEIERRMLLYRKSVDYPDYTGKEIILVDDGVATGSTVLAAIKSLEHLFKPRRLLLAVPVGPIDVIQKLERELDEVVCLQQPEDFRSVGQYFRDFDQVQDDMVINLLKMQ